MAFLRYLWILALAARLTALAQDPPAEIEPPPLEPDPALIEPAEPAPPRPPARTRRARPRNQGPFGNQAGPIFNQQVTVSSNQSVRELFLIGGSADIQGTVERDLVVIGGSATISGQVDGAVVVVGGSLASSGEIGSDTTLVLSRGALQDGSKIHGDAVFVGGPFKLAPGAAIMGERIVVPFGDFLPKIEWFKKWLAKGLMLGRLLPPDVSWAWMVAGFFFVLYGLALLLFPGAVKSVFLALEERPVTSIFSGLLTLVLFAPLTVILVLAVVGIAVVPFLKIALILALLFGKAGVMCFLGRSFGRTSGLAALQAPFIAFLIGGIVLLLAYMVPVFGVLAWALATVFGLGGAIVALASTFKREEGSIPPAPVLLGPSAPAPAGPLPTPVASPMEPMVPSDTLLLPRAGFWKRFLAALLDWVLLALLVPVLGKYFIPVAVAYFVTMWTWKGTTIGSLLLRLRVVRTTGEPVNFAVALVRSLSSLFSALVLFLGFLWTGWDREKQGWHDKIAGTVVVQMPKGFALL